MEPRRVLVLVGSGVAAIGTAVAIHGFQYSRFSFAVAGVACVFAAAPARAAGYLAASSISSAMRTDDMREMGEAWRLMRASATVLLGAGVVLGLCTVSALALAVDSRTKFGVTLGEAVFLASVGALRVFMSVGTGRLQRRRAFDPERVRDAPNAALGWPYWLLLIAIVLVAASLLTGWLGFLDGRTHSAAKAGAYVLWLALALAGFAGAALVHRADRVGALRGSASLSAVAGALVATASTFLDRWALQPALRIVDHTEVLLPAGDSAVGRVSLLTGRLAASTARAPALPVMLLAAVLLAIIVGLLSPGVFR
jgi:NADH:ubiquinone oxidoreductase subunit 5 (subunit L)/multisubunit Na+/H+ antiporter MnhA subunit